MALTNEKGNYIKIIDNGIDLINSEVVCVVYKDEAHRISGDTEFLKSYTVREVIKNLADSLESTGDNKKKVKDILKTICYEELKKGKYAGCADC